MIVICGHGTQRKHEQPASTVTTHDGDGDGGRPDHSVVGGGSGNGRGNGVVGENFSVVVSPMTSSVSQ